MIGGPSANDERITSLLKVCAKNIETYETYLFPTKAASPIEVLKFSFY